MTDTAGPANDPDYQPSPRPPMPDAHGQAALLLAESILHTLVETRVLTGDQAIEVVRIAAEVKVDVAAELGEPSARMLHSLTLLAAIERSLVSNSGDRDTPR